MCCSPSFRWNPAAHWKTLCSPRNLWGFPQTPLVQRLSLIHISREAGKGISGTAHHGSKEWYLWHIRLSISKIKMCIRDRICRWLEGKFRGGHLMHPVPADNLLALPVTLSPVSYTHLDVYKRQSESFNIRPFVLISRISLFLELYAFMLTLSRPILKLSLIHI